MITENPNCLHGLLFTPNQPETAILGLLGGEGRGMILPRFKIQSVCRIIYYSPGGIQAVVLHIRTYSVGIL